MRIHKKLFIILSFVFCSATAYAQNVSFEVKAPPMVAVGKPFTVEFTLNTKPDKLVYAVTGIDNIDGIDVIAGPTPSERNDIMVAGGNVVKQESYGNIYVLVANKPGVFNIPVAKAMAGGKEYSTRETPFEAVEEIDARQQQQSGGGDRQGAQASGDTPASKDDLFIRAVVDKSSVYKGQPVRLYFKLYARNVSIVGTENIKYPDLGGFWAQDLFVDHYTWQKENYNSKVYESRIIKEYFLFPQQVGTLKIDPMEMILATEVVSQKKSQSIFDDFFANPFDWKQESRKVVSSPVTIKVNDFPVGAPPDFNGAVGSFTMTSDFPEGAITANSSANYTIKITGSGNLSFIQAPSLYVPGTFEQYDVKASESFNKSGLSGYKQFDYPLIARVEGDYTIDPVKFVYFNPETAKYVTLETKEYNIEVLPDADNGNTLSGGSIISGISKEEIKILGEDIHFIKLGTAGLVRKGDMFLGSMWYFIILFLILGLFVFALIYLQKRIKEMRNVELVRGKRANKVALQRLKAADSFMKEGSQRNFYEEMLKALWGYMSDKLNIPSAILTKENVREELLKRNMPQEHISRYIDLISACEYAQYSPSGSGHMQEIYANAVKSISKFESLIKR